MERFNLMKRSPTLPMAREKTTLVVQELPGETVVYDQGQHKAHYLDTATALVWKHCDGKMKVGEMARLLEDELKVSSGRVEVRFALGQLKKFNLVL
jgi:hypothetical protein